jgi:thiosulfate dehydrogenase
MNPFRNIRTLQVTLVTLSLCLSTFYSCNQRGKTKLAATSLSGSEADNKDTYFWSPPDTNSISDPGLKRMVNYGRELIVHTSTYFGPEGTLLHITNGMNCQNCHLQAGTVVYANNFGSVASMYPRLRQRSETIENISERVNDCFERSLNGQPLDTAGKEMKAIVAYLQFIGSNVPKGVVAAGSGNGSVPYLDRAADPSKGKTVFTAKCQSCHQPNGEGVLTADKAAYTFPPLWGDHSYNTGAGSYRISKIAGYVKYNMPLGTTYKNPQLSDEEAWNVAAFIITQKRPLFNLAKDWPDISKKPIDYPFGPYADSFSEKQHRFGPFKPVALAYKKSDQAFNNKDPSKK